MASKPYTFDATCDCNRCKTIRADDARARTEALYAKYASLLAGVFPEKTFRAHLNTNLPSGSDPDGVVRQAEVICAHLERLALREQVRECYRDHRAVVGPPITAEWVEQYVRQYLGDAHPLDVVRTRAEALQTSIIAAAKAAYQDGVRRAIAQRRQIAAERAGERAVAERDRADRAEAENRIPYFDELTAPEKEKAVRAAVEVIR